MGNVEASVLGVKSQDIFGLCCTNYYCVSVEVQY